MWYANLVLLLKILSQSLQGTSTSVWTPRMCKYRALFAMNCFPQTLQTKSPTILMQYVVFCCFLGDQLTQTDLLLPSDFVLRVRNCLQNGTRNHPHAAHLFWPKIRSVAGGTTGWQNLLPIQYVMTIYLRKHRSYQRQVFFSSKICFK